MYKGIGELNLLLGTDKPLDTHLRILGISMKYLLKFICYKHLHYWQNALNAHQLNKQYIRSMKSYGNTDEKEGSTRIVLRCSKK